jgi:Zn-dependent M28 family amino/carboxypeptidase
MGKRVVFFAAYTLLVVSVYAQPKANIQETRRDFASGIHAEQMEQKMLVIAGEEFAGRETGEQGQKLCAVYLANFFKSLGFSAVVNAKNQPSDSLYKARSWAPHPMLTGFMQTFPLREETIKEYQFRLQEKEYVFMEDFFAFSGIPDGQYLSEKIVFVGFGIEDKKYGVHDYEGLDVKGKIVLFFEDEPMDKTGNSRITGSGKLSEWTTDLKLKTEAARKAGAIAILSVQKFIENDIRSYKHFIEKPRTYAEGKPSRVSFPKFYISEQMADDIFRRAGKKITVQSLREEYRTGERTKGFEITAPIEIEVKNQIRQITGENILGYIEGTDLKEELVVLTAHYDHLGKDEDGIYYGADDDGSGVVALLEIAEAFAEAKAAGISPRRSILIMPVSGEEKGLLGSEYYSENPVFPLEKTLANLNIDMIGRVDESHKENENYVYVIGADRISPDLHAINENINSTYSGLELDYTYNDPADPNRFYYRSDHYNFAKKGIPSVFFFSGVHEDYHRVTDTPEKIRYEKLAKITRHIFYLTWELANREGSLTIAPKE